MRNDLEILKSLYLPVLEEISVYAPTFKDNFNSEPFWDYFNNLLLDVKNRGKDLADLLNSYKIQRVEHFLERFGILRNEYISYLAIEYCNGATNPTIKLLLKTLYAPFTEEVAFQKDLKTAITLVERARLKKKLAIADELLSFEIADSEINSAFKELEKKNERAELKRKMKEWAKTDSININQELPKRPNNNSNIFKSKHFKTIPILFLRFAAAACLVTGGMWGGYRIYFKVINKSKQTLMIGTTKSSNHLIQLDSVNNKTDSSKINILNDKIKSKLKNYTVNTKDTNFDTNKANKFKTATPIQRNRPPFLLLNGKILDFYSHQNAQDVIVKLVDEKGNIETFNSKDGNFSFKTSINHNYTITGEKQGYTIDHTSLSTMDIKSTDPDDTINVTIHIKKL